MEWQIRMPTVKIIGPYRFFFFSNEGNELPHMTRNQSYFLEAWDAYFTG